ncbi:MAG: hypothetical protein HC904_04125 [Blastochloris sp.]|nr:hypothetical protein [Blastochloris sp.]
MKTTPLILSLLILFLVPLHAENFVFPEDAGVADVKRDYGAKGDGVTDDTEAIKKAMEENRMRPIYFPNGTYLLSDSVGIFDGKAHSRSRFLQLMGQSEAGAILKLKDGSPGFDDPAKPKVFVSTYQGQSTGDAMFTNARNLTIDIGANNPGAVAFRYMTNNFGTMERMTLRSSDPQGAGALGLDLSQSQNGPGLVKNVTIQGFDTGIQSANSFSLVLEHLTLTGQRKIGYHNVISRSTVRGLKIDGAPTAVLLGKHAELTLIEGDFKTQGAANPAIVLEETPYLFLRDVKQSGYQGMIKHPKGENLMADSVDEWSPLTPQRLFGEVSAAKTLRLPILETPVVPWEEDLSKWQRVEWGENGDVSESFQAAIDAAAARVKPRSICPRCGTKAKENTKSPNPCVSTAASTASSA